MTILKGRVVSGIGNFSYWMDKLDKYYTLKTGMKLFPGTLNIQLDVPFSMPKSVLCLEGDEYGGTVSINIIPCKIFGRSAFILRTDKNESGLGDHPKTIIEIATDVKLRDVYGLNDGDSVEVEIHE